MIRLLESISLSLVIILSGIGMQLKQKWGWCLAVFFYVYELAATGVTYFAAYFLDVYRFTNNEDLRVEVSVEFIKAIIFLVIVRFLFSLNVLAYFQLNHWNRAKVFWVMVGISLPLSCVRVAQLLILY